MSSSSDDLLLMEGVCRDFGGVRVLSEIDISVGPGEIVGILGPDGAGKSTLLGVAAGVLAPTEGRVLIAGKAPARARREFSYVPLDIGLYNDLTPREHLSYLAGLYRVEGSRVDELLHMAGLVPAQGRLIGKLSGGMRQKLALVAGFIHRPRLLLLDEPTRGIDPVFRQEIWSLLYGVAGQGAGVLLTTSDIQEAERVFRVYFLEQGRIKARGTPEELKRGLRGRVFLIRGGPEAYRWLRARGIPGRISGDGVRCVARARDLEGMDFTEAEPTLGDVFLI